MKLSFVASILIGIVIVGCSTVDSTAVGVVPKIATPMVSSLQKGAMTNVLIITPVVLSGCTLTGGGAVQTGWSGLETGTNACNRCFCTDGVLGCTKMACLTSPPKIASSSEPTNSELPDISYFAENKSDRKPSLQTSRKRYLT